MKKLFICLLVLLLFVALCSCGSDDSSKVCDHDWGPERTVEDCQSFTVTKICSKCHTESWLHGDYGWPQHKWAEETKDGQTTFTCTRCKESYSFSGEIAAFSYAEVLEEYRLGDPGVRQENFYISVYNGMTSVIDAILMAKYYQTVEYDTIAVSFDEASGVWGVVFYTDGVDGGDQSIYVNPTDKTCYIVCGK